MQDCLGLLRLSKKPLGVALLQTVYVDPATFAIQDWYYSDAQTVLRVNPIKSPMHADLMNTFLRDSFTETEHRAYETRSNRSSQQEY